MTDLVKRLREYAQVAHMAAAWGFAGEGYTMEKAADRIEALEAENKRLREALEHLDVGDGYAAQVARSALAQTSVSEGEE